MTTHKRGAYIEGPCQQGGVDGGKRENVPPLLLSSLQGMEGGEMGWKGKRRNEDLSREKKKVEKCR